MASVFTNRGAADLAANPPASAVLRLLAVTTAPASDAAARDLNTVSQITGEATAAGYSRATLAGVTVTEDDTADAAIVTATMPVSLGTPAAGETIVGVWIFRRAGGADAGTDPLWAWIDTNDVPTNGSGIQLNQAGGEIGRLSTA